jgi:hypothetical protein
MTSTRPNKWIVALCGLAGAISAIDVFEALKNGDSHFAQPNSQLLIAGSRVLLAVALVISMYVPQRRPIPIAVAVGALSLGIWGALIK